MNKSISLRILLKRFWNKAILTWTLVVLEGVSLLITPLLIGRAIDDLLKGKTYGLYQLGILCMILMVCGAGRRFYDTRLYAQIYRKVSNEIVEKETSMKTNVSKISARVNLFSEFIEFLENSLPDIVNQFLGLFGTLCIIFCIDFKIFCACLTGAVLTAFIYIISQKKMFNLNKGQNDEFEKQVDIITSYGPEKGKLHFKNLMAWNIKLSDLETINFSITWIILTGILLYSVVVIATPAATSFGQVISIIMYIFGFMENVMSFPLHYQQMIRLQEIAGRLA